MKVAVTIGILLIIAVVLWNATAYRVNEFEQIIITQFGKPVAQVKVPGLHFKKPFIQEKHALDKRLLPWDGDSETMVTKDKKSIFIDVWARWRIVDPMKYFQAVRTMGRGQKILDDLVDSSVRDIIAGHNLIECVRSSNEPLQYEIEEFEFERDRTAENIAFGRSELERLMLESVGTSADLEATYGMAVTEIHIKRVNYVDNVRDQVYNRMKSERTRIARLFESEAEEERNRILGNTRKELDEIEGDMDQKSAEIRGAADAEVIRIYAEAINQDPEFYEFLRLLEAYEQTLTEGTRLILSTDNDFLKLLDSPHDVAKE